MRKKSVLGCVRGIYGGRGRTECLVWDLEPEEIKACKLNWTLDTPDGVLDAGGLSGGSRTRNIAANPQVCAIGWKGSTSIRIQAEPATQRKDLPSYKKTILTSATTEGGPTGEKLTCVN